MFVCMVVCVSARPITNDPDRFLAISCKQDIMWATPSDICRDFLDSLRTPTPTQNPGSSSLLSTTPLIPTLPVLLVRSAQMADWLKTFLGICSGLITIYSSVVSYLGFVRKIGFSAIPYLRPVWFRVRRSGWRRLPPRSDFRDCSFWYGPLNFYMPNLFYLLMFCCPSLLPNSFGTLIFLDCP